MNTIALGNGPLLASRLAYGCWRIAGTATPGSLSPEAEAAGRQAVIAAYEAGYTLFDHADIYADGLGEWIFGQVLKEISGMRDQVLIATKCGIRKAGQPDPRSAYRFDASASYIKWACEQSLKRLGVETIDLYQLHRPDYLCQPEEVAEAFVELQKSGKVLNFGVSNYRPSQVTALQRACPMRLLVNQVEISLAKVDPFENGLLDHCLAEKITPLAWSPLGGGHLTGGARKVLASQEAYGELPVVQQLEEMARQRGVPRMVLALAWLLKHPSGIIPIIGSTRPERIRLATEALSLELTRDEWYQLFTVARGQSLP